MVKLKEKPIKDQVIEAIELQMNTDIADTKKRTDLDSKQKEEAIQQIQETANKDKANVKNIHDIMQKVDATLGIDYALTQFNLELQKFTINEQLDKIQPDNVKEELENQLNEVEQDLTNLTNTILDEEGGVKEEFVSEAAQEFDTKADEFLDKMKDSGADVIVVETAEDAEAIANSYGVSMQGQAAKFIRLPNGDRKLLFSKESTLNNARINDGVVKLDFDHEGDHFFIDELEQMTGDSEITLQIGEDIDNAIANGDIVFKNKKAEKEFQDLMDQYANRNPNDPVALADETIANMRQFMDEGKASFKKPIYDKIKQSINNFVGKATDNTIEIDVENNGELLKILDLMREGETEQVAEVIEKAKTKRKPRKTPPSILEPIGQSEDQAKERLALDDNIKEKKDLIEKIKKLVADGKAKNKTEIEKAQQRLVVLNRGIANAEDVAIIEDPKSSASAKQAAENRLIKRNQEPIVEDLLNKKMSGDVYYGTITLRDGSQIKAQVPRSEIKEALMGEEFTKIYKKFFTRDASLKDVPIGFKLMNDLAFRWQQVVDPLVEKYAREQRDRQEDEGVSYFETTPDFNDDGIINDIDKKIAKDDDAVINMRQAIGILPGSDIFNKVKEGVVNTFKGKLPDIESGDLKKALLDSFAIQGADAVRLLIDEMGGVEPFLTTYGEQVYDLIPQSIMNKSFQDFIIQGKRLGVEETRDAQSKGLISKQKTKKGKKETSGYFLYEKEKYDKNKWIKYHTDPKSVGAKGTKYSKKNQLVDVIAKSLGADAAMEVMSQPDMMEMYNERNKLLNQTEVLVEDIGNILEKDPKARFALNISADRIPYIQKQIIGVITRAYDSAVKGMDFAADMLDEEFSLLPEELLKAFPDTFERIKQLFNTSATGFKKKLKQDIETADIPENYKELAREVNETQTQSKGKGVPSSMAQMHAFGKKVIGKINLDVIKNLKGANFFSYIYGYLDGGDKSKGKGTKFGDYKSELDEVNKIISKLKNNDELDFDPNDIRLLNATSGILQKAEKILNEDYTEKGGREAKLKKLGFDPNTGEVKPGSIMDQLQKANEANIKAIDYIMRKSAISISEDNSLIPGFLRWLESMTNNTKSLRALSRLANMEVSAKPQAAYYNPETDSYENSLSAAQKKSGDWVANYNHPRYEEAEKMAKQKTDDPIEQQKIIAQKLNYKGEHIDVASNLYAKLGIQVLEAAAKLENAKSDKEKEGILESLSNKNTLALMKYDQAHTTKVEADQIDAKTSTTDATDYIRMKSDFVLKATPDKIVVSDPTMDPSQDIDSKIVSEQELIDAVENSIEDTQKVKERNAERLEDSGVAGMEGDLTGPEVLGKMATLDAVLIKARTGKYPKTAQEN